MLWPRLISSHDAQPPSPTQLVACAITPLCKKGKTSQKGELGERLSSSPGSTAKCFLLPENRGVVRTTALSPLSRGSRKRVAAQLPGWPCCVLSFAVVDLGTGSFTRIAEERKRLRLRSWLVIASDLTLHTSRVSRPENLLDLLPGLDRSLVQVEHPPFLESPSVGMSDFLRLQLGLTDPRFPRHLRLYLQYFRLLQQKNVSKPFQRSPFAWTVLSVEVGSGKWPSFSSRSHLSVPSKVEDRATNGSTYSPPEDIISSRTCSIPSNRGLSEDVAVGQLANDVRADSNAKSRSSSWHGQVVVSATRQSCNSRFLFFAHAPWYSKNSSCGDGSAPETHLWRVRSCAVRHFLKRHSDSPGTTPADNLTAHARSSGISVWLRTQKA